MQDLTTTRPSTPHPGNNVHPVADSIQTARPAQFPTAPLSEIAAAALERLERAFAPKAVTV